MDGGGEETQKMSNNTTHCMNRIKWLMWMWDMINWHKYRQSKTHLYYNGKQNICVIDTRVRKKNKIKQNTSLKENVQIAHDFGEEDKEETKKNRFNTWNEWLKCIKYVKKV